MNEEEVKNMFCQMVETILKAKGKKPNWFARRHKYRARTDIEWNNRYLWFEKRLDGTYRLDTPKGITDTRTLLEFTKIDNKYIVSTYNFNAEDIIRFKKVYSKTRTRIVLEWGGEVNIEYSDDGNSVSRISIGGHNIVYGIWSILERLDGKDVVLTLEELSRR